MASFTVAIDGPAAAGKGTVARAVAAHFGFAYLDSGLLYRAVAANSLTGADPIETAQLLTPAMLEQDNLRSPEVSQEASMVAAIPEVRAALLEFQQVFARRDGGAVIDGRDIGTVICPKAEAKLFVTASADVRARRRFDELIFKGTDTRFEAVLADVRARDKRDANRTDSPMIAADDAVTLDTSDLAIDTAVAFATELIRSKSVPGA
ncbi:MAG: (d)CMP kinase [Rhodobacteraceae bacterium]|nr:(d)CMP kinase [Paracoccaceae bacterium]